MTVDPSGRPTLDRTPALAHAREVVRLWNAGEQFFQHPHEAYVGMAETLILVEAELAAVTERADRAERERDEAAAIGAEMGRQAAERRVGELQAQLAALAGLIDDGATAPLANARSAIRTGDYSGWIDGETAAWLCIVADTLATSVPESEPSVAVEPGTEQT